MAQKTSLLAAGVVTSVAALGLVGLPAASAQSSEGGFMSSLASSIAERFNLDQTEVETFLDEQKDEFKAERQAAREEKRAEYIAGLVEEGTLTQEQADALAEKRAELEAEKEALKDQNLTRKEIREAMEETRDEFEAWAEEQGIDLDEIRPEHKRGGYRGHYHHPYADKDATDNSDDINNSVQEL